MFLSEVYAENFRLFGSGENSLCLKLEPGLNALVGENDGGKSSVIDAIRFCLWTTSQDYHRLTEDDFHCDETGRKPALTLRCKFDGLSTADKATFLEWLTTEGQDHQVLYIHVRATLMDGGRRGRVAVEVHAGRDGESLAIEGAVRELLKTTYLRPLRDAESELSSGRNSRLSQILISHPDIALQADDDFDPTNPNSGTTLVGIMKRAEYHVGTNDAVKTANDTINREYLEKFQIGSEQLASEVGVAGDTTLNRILEKLELAIAKPSTSLERTRRGLGFNNALFMSAELLLLGSREAYPTLLIEEPEAHLHPQMQASVIALLNDRAQAPADGSRKAVQVILTTHSPTLASAIPLDRVTLIAGGKPYGLARTFTRLSEGDYAFLERFLDSTKANLFFAKGVAIVEGDAENLLLPVLAELSGYSFRTNGISVVNVGHVGLFRYSNIFRRADGTTMSVKVACLRDRDIVPDHVPDESKGKLKKTSEYTEQTLNDRLTRFCSEDGESVRTFVSDIWTLEYDLACASWEMAKVMLRSVTCAVEAHSAWPNEVKVAELILEADSKLDVWRKEGKTIDIVAWLIYAPLKHGDGSKVVTAQFASRFAVELNITRDSMPAYLISAFKHLAGEVDGPAD